MCEVCDEIILRDSFYSPKDYLNCIGYITELINSKKYVIIEQTCPLHDVITPKGFWAGDIIHHKIKCVKCGERFYVDVDTYHGCGGFRRDVHP